MNIIYFDLWHLNGALVDALEYFLFLKKHRIEVKLAIFENIGGLKREDLFNIIYDRYEVDFDFQESIIVLKKKSEIVHIKGHTMMMVDWGSFCSIPFIPNLWDKVILWFDYRDEKIIDKYKNADRFTNVKIFKEMPYEYGVDYKFKFSFDLYRNFASAPQNVAYINLNSKGELSKYYDHIDFSSFDKVYVSGNVNDPNVHKLKEHPKDFFSLFDTYIYVHDDKYFDPRPRMFHESIFYKKKIIYINVNNQKDGSYYRYHEALKNGVNHRALTLKDPIIQEFF